MLDLNYHESAALVDTHSKRCKLRTEAESARAEAVAQRTSFAEMRPISERVHASLVPSSTKQSISHPVYKLKAVVKLEDRYLCRGGCAFPARSTPDHKSYSFRKLREMINNLTTHLEEEASSEVKQKGWCDTELIMNTQMIEERIATMEKLHATVDEFKASMEYLAMEVAELFAQLSRIREKVSNATSIRHEETATNEEAIKEL